MSEIIDFEQIEEKKVKNLYEFMWNDHSKIPGTDGICKTWSVYKNNVIESNNSFSFCINGLDNKNIVTKRINKGIKKKICTQLIKTFNIENDIQFEKKFFEVCNGSGKEAANLIRLHSSALCALLFFHNIFHNDEKKINNEIHIKIDGKLVTFNNVFFEYKNNVVDINHPSNVDVVLISKKGDKILFLESKFAEYYLRCGGKTISSKYKEHPIGKKFYNNKILEKFQLHLDNTEGKDFKVYSDKSTITNCVSYVEGIKQMISHYIGILNFINGDKADSRCEELRACLSRGYKVYLGEILFDFKKDDNCENDEIKNYRLDYEKKYGKLADFLNDSSHNTSKTQIKCLNKVLYYSDFKKYVNPTIKQFYFGE